MFVYVGSCLSLQPTLVVPRFPPLCAYLNTIFVCFPRTKLAFCLRHLHSFSSRHHNRQTAPTRDSLPLPRIPVARRSATPVSRCTQARTTCPLPINLPLPHPPTTPPSLSPLAEYCQVIFPPGSGIAAAAAVGTTSIPGDVDVSCVNDAMQPDRAQEGVWKDSRLEDAERCSPTCTLFVA